MSVFLSFMQIYQHRRQFKTRLLFLIIILVFGSLSEGYSQKRVYTSDSSAYAIGDVVDGKKTGKWQFYTSEDKLLEAGQFVDDKRQGEWKLFDSAGQLPGEVFYENDMPVY